MKKRLGIANRENFQSAQALSLILYALSEGAISPENIQENQPPERYIFIKNLDKHIAASIAYEQKVLGDLLDENKPLFPSDILNFRFQHALAQAQKIQDGQKNSV